jgi:hypothetical protein
MAASATPGTNVWTSNTAPNKLGSAPKDSNRESIPFASGIVTQDYTGRNASTPDATTDVTSPTAVLTANAIALIIPPNAVTITMNSTAAFAFGEVGPAGAPLTQSYLQPAGVPVTVNVARQKFLYVTGSAALNFFFQTL